MVLRTAPNDEVNECTIAVRDEMVFAYEVMNVSVRQMAGVSSLQAFQIAAICEQVSLSFEWKFLCDTKGGGAGCRRSFLYSSGTCHRSWQAQLQYHSSGQQWQNQIG